MSLLSKVRFSIYGLAIYLRGSLFTININILTLSFSSSVAIYRRISKQQL